MSDTIERISMDALIRLLGGPSCDAAEIARRLEDYEAREIVTPEVRSVPIVLPNVQHTFDASNLFPGGRSASARGREAWYEGQRTAGLPPLNPAPAFAKREAKYYSRDDCKAIGPYEREVTALRSEFCRWAFRTEVDPAAAKVPAEILQDNSTAELRRLLVGAGHVTKDDARVEWRTVIENKKMIAAARNVVSGTGGSGRWDRQRFQDAARLHGYEFHFAPSRPKHASAPSNGGAMDTIAQALKRR